MSHCLAHPAWMLLRQLLLEHFGALPLEDLVVARQEFALWMRIDVQRGEVLEPALAGRPGRIDQAIEIGLPEDRERRLLLARYSGAIGLADEALGAISRRTGKVSPSFIKELCRRAAQSMLERDGKTLEERDFEQSLEDLRMRPKGVSSGRGQVGFVG